MLTDDLEILEDLALNCEACSGESFLLVVINGKITCHQCALGSRERCCE